MAYRLLVLAALALAGCDNAIETPPSLNTYTLWGALDPTADVQSVRVIRVADTLVARTEAPLPITVASVDMNTGIETPWRDSVVTYRDRSIGHVYHAAFRPDYGGRYRLVVRRDSGIDVTAETTIPPEVTPRLLPTDLNQGVRKPVAWDGAPQLGRLRVRYFVQKYNVLVAGGFESGRPLCERDTVAYALPADPGQVDGGWLTRLDYFRIQKLLDDQLREQPPEFVVSRIPPGGPVDRRFQVDLRKIEVSAEVLSENWRPPGGVFDFEVLAAADVFDNVMGGFGFVGGGYASSITFRTERSDLSRAGFFNNEPFCGLS